MAAEAEAEVGAMEDIGTTIHTTTDHPATIAAEVVAVAEVAEAVMVAMEEEAAEIGSRITQTTTARSIANM
jgi:hypothetical protein